jgi:hypothetical protein
MVSEFFMVYDDECLGWRDQQVNVSIRVVRKTKDEKKFTMTFIV